MNKKFLLKSTFNSNKFSYFSNHAKFKQKIFSANKNLSHSVPNSSAVL